MKRMSMSATEVTVILLLLCFLDFGIAGCATDGSGRSPNDSEAAILSESDDASKRKVRRKRLTLDDGRRGRVEPVLKNPEMVAPPGGAGIPSSDPTQSDEGSDP